MNWQAVMVFALIACCAASVVTFACMMANIEYGSPRTSWQFAGGLAALLVFDALLLGAVW